MLPNEPEVSSSDSSNKASGTSAAMQAAVLALDNIYVPGTNGIIEDDVERTIQNIGYIASKAMNEADNVILDIMLNKQ